jgi:nicotinate-nucleotide adenylyltransferase
MRAFMAELSAYLKRRGVMKIGIYGGAFNPPHIGHARLAAQSVAQLELDRLFIIPAGEPPHKSIPPGSPDARERLELARAAFGDIESVEVSDYETSRGGVSYTADTARRFCEEYARAHVYLITGEDMFLSLREWRAAGDVLRRVIPAAGSRGAREDPRVAAQADAIEREYGVRTRFVTFDPLEASSSRLRGALREGGGKEYLAENVYECIIRGGLYGARPDLEWLRARAYAMLDDARVEHVKGCEREAARLAGRWGADERDAREAAILHDITKRLGAREQLEICERYGLRVDEIEREHAKLLHAKTGAALASDMFAATDAVRDAILWHTTARAGMTVLEKVIYLADYIEPTRAFEEVGELRRLAYEDLDAAVIYGLEISIADITSRGVAPHPRSAEALRYLRERAGKINSERDLVVR